ncbi:DUF4194 domain-containing protein [Luteibacter sahnii]|uniref:DUF4194 domain-containing protein n=1 Tax=Luteibacter sahnii TaxID=3021977 RepID=UPI002A6A27F3|nr:DUF4194 domain-containing protein [Luteibacter sp. PPL193]MDY1548038.1 DUF4194 domain-containing protein [Luteibacter sp. PPL193]
MTLPMEDAPASDATMDTPVALPTEPEAPHGTVHAGMRAALLELMKYGLLEAASKPNLYRAALTHTAELSGVLQWMDLAVRVDDIRGLVFLVVATTDAEETDDWSHPLVRRQRLTLEQSLLVALLRQAFVAHEIEAGIGAADARVTLDDLVPHLQAYLGHLGSDAKEKKRLLTLLEQLKGHGVVSDVDQHERVTIRPIIVHLANPDSLAGLIRTLKALAESAPSAAPSLIGTDV